MPTDLNSHLASLLRLSKNRLLENVRSCFPAELSGPQAHAAGPAEEMLPGGAWPRAYIIYIVAYEAPDAEISGPCCRSPLTIIKACPLMPSPPSAITADADGDLEQSRQTPAPSDLRRLPLPSPRGSASTLHVCVHSATRWAVRIT